MRSDYKTKKDLNGGIQLIWHFKNGYGLSVIKHNTSYGQEKGLWEAAIISGTKKNWNIEGRNSISKDWGGVDWGGLVKGYLQDADVDELLTKVENLAKKV